MEDVKYSMRSARRASLSRDCRSASSMRAARRWSAARDSLAICVCHGVRLAVCSKDGGRGAAVPIVARRGRVVSLLLLVFGGLVFALFDGAHHAQPGAAPFAFPPA